MTGVAVKLTVVPAHTVLPVEAMDTDTGSSGLTVMVMALDVAGLPVGQAMEEVSRQVTASPLTGTKLYEAFVAPVTLVPLTLHW